MIYTNVKTNCTLPSAYWFEFVVIKYIHSVVSSGQLLQYLDVSFGYLDSHLHKITVNTLFFFLYTYVYYVESGYNVWRFSLRHLLTIKGLSYVFRLFVRITPLTFCRPTDLLRQVCVFYSCKFFSKGTEPLLKLKVLKIKWNLIFVMCSFVYSLFYQSLHKETSFISKRLFWLLLFFSINVFCLERQTVTIFHHSFFFFLTRRIRKRRLNRQSMLLKVWFFLLVWNYLIYKFRQKHSIIVLMWKSKFRGFIQYILYLM